jgi:hypothetical protein
MSPVHVLQMSPVHVLQMSPVQVLQVQSSPGFTTCRICCAARYESEILVFCYYLVNYLLDLFQICCVNWYFYLRCPGNVWWTQIILFVFYFGFWILTVGKIWNNYRVSFEYFTDCVRVFSYLYTSFAWTFVGTVFVLSFETFWCLFGFVWWSIFRHLFVLLSYRVLSIYYLVLSWWNLLIQLWLHWRYLIETLLIYSYSASVHLQQVSVLYYKYNSNYKRFVDFPTVKFPN